MNGDRRIEDELLALSVEGSAPPGVDRVMADLIRPADLEEGPLMVCLPGGGMSRRYFDLQGDPAGDWSMARYLAERFGFAVAVLDHPGIGESDVPRDPSTLVPRVVAEVDAVAIAELRNSLIEDEVYRATTLIGCGHSMGAMLTTHLQWRHPMFDAMVLLGFGGAGLVDLLTDDERSFVGDHDALEPALPSLAMQRFGTMIVESSTTSSEFLNPDTVADARALLGTAATGLLAMCGLTSMIPGTSDAALASVRVPVFLGLGENDIAGDIDAVAALLTSAPQVERFVLAGAGHNHSISRNRTELWDAIGGWVAAL